MTPRAIQPSSTSPPNKAARRAPARNASKCAPYLLSAKINPAPSHQAQNIPTPQPALLDFYSLGIERWIEIGRASLAAAVCFNSCVMEFYKDSLGFAPALGTHFETAAKLFVNFSEQQINCLGLWLSQPARVATALSAILFRKEAEVLEQLEEEVMEVEADAVERCMDVAIGARKAA